MQRQADRPKPRSSLKITISFIRGVAEVAGFLLLLLMFLGSIGVGNFALYYGLDEVIVITCPDCSSEEVIPKVQT